MIFFNLKITVNVTKQMGFIVMKEGLILVWTAKNRKKSNV